MKNYKINAKVLVNFNDKTKPNEDGSFYTWEKGEVIENMPRERFEELESKGYVEEFKGKAKNEIQEQKNNSEWN